MTLSISHKGNRSRDKILRITKDIYAIDLSLYLINEKVLIISDIHIGFEEALNKQGILVPRFQLKDLIQRVGRITSILKDNKLRVKKIIINGDLKHEFGRISEQEWKDTMKFLSFLKKKCNNILLIKGNHDNILGPIASKNEVEIKNYYRFKDILVTHGHKIPRIAYNKEIKTIIIGHEHPAVSISDKLRSELFKAFLIGSWNHKRLIVMPSLCLVTEGTNILREKTLSPFLSNVNLNKFRVLVVGDKIYDFGSISDLLKTD